MYNSDKIEACEIYYRHMSSTAALVFPPVFVYNLNKNIT